MPKVSVCIPTFQQTNYLKKTLDSLKNQSYKDYELIITDDSLDNNVEKFLENYHFPTLKYFRNSQRLGSPENWNESIHLAQGDYIKLLHHDDWFPHNDCLATFVKALDENTSVDFAFSATLVCKDEGYRLFQASKDELNTLIRNPETLILKNFIGAPSACIYRNDNDLAYKKNLKWLVDIEFYIQFLQKHPNFYYHTEPLICTTDGAHHQVTTSCIDNKTVELYEYLYLYEIFYNKIDNRTDFTILLNNLFNKYQINSFAELIKYTKIDLLPLKKKCKSVIKRIQYKNYQKQLLYYIRKIKLIK